MIVLDSRFLPPLDFGWQFFVDPLSGVRIRYGCLPALGTARYAALIVTGFNEPADKYFEVAAEQRRQGAIVFLMDWRGQGGSDRYLPNSPEKSHHLGYDGCIATLAHFARAHIRPVIRVPLFLFAHSMGAHIALRTLAQEPNLFDAAILSDPMLQFDTQPLPERVVRCLSSFAVRHGWEETYVPGGGPWTVKSHSFAGNRKTSDPQRFSVQKILYEKNPVLRMGAPTFGWVWHSYQSCDILNQETVLHSIQTPILMQISGTNGIVKRASILRATQLLPRCRTVDIPAAKHEIWMERNDLRQQMVVAVNQFIDDFLAKGELS